MASSSVKTPRDFLRVAFRHRIMFFLVASLFAIVSLYGAQYVPKKYTSVTKFVRRISGASGPQGRGSDSFSASKETLTQELAGQPALERVAQDLGLLEGLPHDENGQLTEEGVAKKQRIIAQLKEDVSVQWEVRSESVDRIAVEVTRSDALEAQRIPDALVDNYITYSSEITVQRLTDDRTFLAKRVNDCKLRLSDQQNKRIEFETEHRGSMPDQPGELQETIVQLQSKLDSARKQHIEATKTLDVMRSQREIATTNPSTQPNEVVKVPNPEIVRLRERLSRMEAELDECVIRLKMLPKHPRVVDLKANIEQVKAQIDETPPEVIEKRVFTALPKQHKVSMEEALAMSDRDIANREIIRLEKILKSKDALLLDFKFKRAAYEEMLTKIAKLNAELGRWEEQYNDVQMKLAAEVAKRRTQLDKVQRAQKQVLPSSPSLTMILGFSLVGGLGAAGGLVFLLHLMDRSISTTENAIKYFDVPICGVISEIQSRKAIRLKRLRRWLLYPVMSLVMFVALSVCVVNIYLQLREPARYKIWKAEIVRFISKEIPL